MNRFKWLRSFRHAYEGLIYALQTEKNMRFHFFAAFFVLVVALLCNLSKTDILFIILAIVLMIATELLNTAIENAVDLAMPDQHPIAKIAKDVAAAAALVAALFAVAVGTIVFYEPIDALLRGHSWQFRRGTVATFWLFASIVTLVLVVIHARFSQKNVRHRPSLLSALSLSLATMIGLIAGHTIVLLLALSMSIIIGLLLHDKTERSLFSIVSGGLVGVIFSIALYSLL